MGTMPRNVSAVSDSLFQRVRRMGWTLPATRRAIRTRWLHSSTRATA